MFQRTSFVESVKIGRLRSLERLSLNNLLLTFANHGGPFGLREHRGGLGRLLHGLWRHNRFVEVSYGSASKLLELAVFVVFHLSFRIFKPVIWSCLHSFVGVLDMLE